MGTLEPEPNAEIHLPQDLSHLSRYEFWILFSEKFAREVFFFSEDELRSTYMSSWSMYK